jgi:class 3 adenylate cyclase
MKITPELRAHAQEQAGNRCECLGANCRHHRGGARCKRGLRGDQWKVYWRTEKGGTARDNIDAWCLDCFQNNFAVPTSAVTLLFPEIVDYAVLTDADRRKAITLMAVFHEAADRVAKEHAGRLSKTETDEVFLEFEKSLYALRAARALKERFHEDARRLSLPTPELCSGIHCGEVTRSRDGELFGDAVGIASGVKGVARAGQIVLTGSVVAQLDDGMDLEDLGEQSIADVPEPLRCWAVRY